jgi:hypothetical protein
MILRLLPACLLAASPVWADCPVADDLATGIRLTGADGTVEIYRAIDDGLVELRLSYPDGNGDLNLLGQGVYLIEAMPLLADAPDLSDRTIITYPMSPGDMPLPAPGASWDVTIDLDDGAQEKVALRWGQIERRSYGTCAYDVIRGEGSYAGIGYRDIEELHYLPELGFAYLASFRAEGDDMADEFTILRIDRAEQTE